MRNVLILCNIDCASRRILGIIKYSNHKKYNFFLLCPNYDLTERPFAPSRDLHKYCKIYTLEHNCLIGNEPTNSKLKYLLDSSKIMGNISRAIYYNIKSLKNYPDLDYKLKDRLILKACEIIKNENINVVLSSSPPVTYHIVAKKLKQRYPHLKWVADLRDLWAENYTSCFIRRMRDKKLEKQTLQYADAITTVSVGLQETLKRKYDSVYAINNGFDPDDFTNSTNFCVSRNQKLTLSYAGNLYFGKHNPEYLLKALKNLVDTKKISKSNIEVNFYTPNLIWLRRLISKYGLNNIVHMRGLRPSQEMPKIWAQSDILLVFGWEDSKQKGTLPRKMYDALGAKKNILAIGGPDDELANILAETKAGFYLRTVVDVEKQILRFYNEFSKNGVLQYNGVTKNILKYSFQNIAKKYMTVFESMFD